MRRGLFALAAVIGATFAIGAAPAMAALHFSDTTKGIKLSGSVTAYKGGGSAKTCTPVATQTGVFWAPESGYIESGSALLNFSCGGPTLQMEFMFGALNTTTLEVGGETPNILSPWGAWYNQGEWVGGSGLATVDWKNGSGGTASTITFSNDPIGYVQAAGFPTVTLSGSLKVTTSSGGLLTLLP